MRSKASLILALCLAALVFTPGLAAPQKSSSISSQKDSRIHRRAEPPGKSSPADAKERVQSVRLRSVLPQGKVPRVSDKALSAATALKTDQGREAAILWSVATGTPARIIGPLGEKSFAPPRHIATDFLKTHHRLFSLKSDLSDLRLSRMSRNSGGHHITFQQLCQGIPVEGATVKVHLFKDGRVQTVTSRLSAGLHPEMQARVSREEAIAISSHHLRLTGELRGEIVAEEVILPEPRPGTLAWKVSIPARQPAGDWVILVHARDGTVLSTRDIRMFATGTGYVFDPNPVVALRTTDLSDQNDSGSAVPQEAYTSVLLEGLDNTGYLRGPYVDTALTSGRVYSADLDFGYDRSHRGFEEVMIYYHIQQFQKYLQDELDASLATRQVLADAHATEEDNSYFSPLIRAVYFGDGGVDDAEDAYIILHEYVHAVSYDALRETPLNQECSAMSEGTADYLAASFFAEHDFEAAVFGQWDGIANTPLGVRRLDSDKVYPADMIGEDHDDGEIWSSGLWQLRAQVGGTIADKLVVQSVHYLDGSSLFSDGLQALLLADTALYGRAHADAISTAFAAKGIVVQTLMNLGDTRTGMLAQGDLTLPDGSYYDPYTFQATAGQVVKIALNSNDFDAYLLLLDPYFNGMAHGDDLADGSTNARIVLTIPYTGAYHILANAYAGGDAGRYSLSLSAGSLSEGTPQSTAIAFDRQVSGHLGSGDYAFDDDTFYDEYTFAGHVGQEIAISMSSAETDAYLILYDSDYAILANDDDSGPGTDALITYTLPYDGEYSLAANQALPGSGDYTVSITSSDPHLPLATIVSGTLEDGDLQMTSDDSYFDAYRFQGTAGQTLSFKMYSPDFDPYLIVYGPYFNTVTEVDDVAATNTNAVLEEFELRITGTYFVIANAYHPGETGAYKLAVCPPSITDTDSDGYPDRTELAESTDPLDASSVPDDVDGDLIPDSMDPDNDNDGMPNLYENAQGFNPLDASDGPTDADLDGMSNLAEFVAGTDPHSAASLFHVLDMFLGAQGLTLQWSSVPGHHYAIHRSTDLLHWDLAEPDVPSQGDVTLWTETDQNASRAVFYRVEAMPSVP